MNSSQIGFKQCSPVKAIDGYYYVAADMSDNFSPYHIQFEKDCGNVIEVQRVREIFSEEEINEGDLVSFGSTVTVWEIVSKG